MDILTPTLVTIFEATALHQGWQEVAVQPVTVDLSQVSEVDAAGLQLLLYWKNSDQTSVTFSQPSDALRQGSDSLNLSDVLWPREADDE